MVVWENTPYISGENVHEMVSDSFDTYEDALSCIHEYINHGSADDVRQRKSFIKRGKSKRLMGTSFLRFEIHALIDGEDAIRHVLKSTLDFEECS